MNWNFFFDKNYQKKKLPKKEITKKRNYQERKLSKKKITKKGNC
jgi:hypothetical protein